MTQVTEEGWPGPYHCTVLRGLSFMLSVVHLVMAMAPSLVLVNFVAHRAYIERELCVQREMAADMRTCHGECQLSKRLKALEHEAQQDLPRDLVMLRTEPAMPQTEPTPLPERAAERRFFPLSEPDLASGHRSSIEPVPWA